MAKFKLKNLSHTIEIYYRKSNYIWWRTIFSITKAILKRLSFSVIDYIPKVVTNLRRPEIIVSLTTTSFRIQYIEPVLKSILNQSIGATSVNLYLGKDGFRYDKGFSNTPIPDFLNKMAEKGQVKIHYVENLGSYTKIMNCLEDNFGRDCIIITADDDILYPHDWIWVLYKMHKRYPNSVITLRGRKIAFSNDRMLPYLQWKMGEGYYLLNFATGRDGTLYKPCFFDKRVFDKKYLEICPTADDVWLKFATLANNIGVYIIDPNSQLPEIRIPNNVTLIQFNKIANDIQIKNVMEYFGFSENALSSIRDK